MIGRATHRVITALIAALLLFPVTAQCQQSWGSEDVARMFGSSSHRAPVEGVWKFPAGGAKIMIIASAPDTYDIRLLDSDALAIAPGTVIGTVYSTAKPMYFEGKIDTGKLGLKSKVKGNNFILYINSDDRLCIDGYREGYSLSFKRLFYRIFKISFEEHNEHPKGLVGAKRIFPINEYHDLPISL